MKKKQLKLATYYPMHVTTYGIGDAALNITQNMNSSDLSATLFCPISAPSVSKYCKKDLLPPIFKKIYLMLLNSRAQQALANMLFLMRTKSADIIYIWPSFSVDLIKKIKSRGQIVVIENINCHQQTVKQILDQEYKLLGIKNPNRITTAEIENETEVLSICDFVFSPSPQVTLSLQKAGISEKKILTVSYGLKQEHRLPFSPPENKNRPFTAIFVGRVGIRKGVHLLLDYWVSANIEGTLKIIGAVEPEFDKIMDTYNDHANIEFIDFTDNLAKYYSSADLFILPSLEEGSPLVTYQAIGAGLPALVSPMGGEGVIRHGIDGYIIPPHDKNIWVKHIREIATSPSLCKNLSKASHERSQEFLWQNTGKSRAEMLLSKLEEKNI